MAEAKDVKAALQRELANLTKARDELKLQMKLGMDEFRDEWKKIESTWQGVEAEIKRVGEQTREPVKDMAEAAKNLMGELRGGLDRIKAQLKQQPPQASSGGPSA